MRRRLVLSYVTITLIVLLALGIPLGVLFARAERRALEESVRRDALAMSIRAEEPLESGDVSSLPGLATQYQKRTNGRVVIVEAQGRVVADSDPPVEGVRSFSSRTEIAQALRGFEATGTRRSNTLGTDLFYAAVPVNGGDKGVVGAVRVSYPTSYVDARVARAWWLLGAVGLVVLLLVTLVSLWLARTVTRPLADLEDGAKKLGRGDLDARVPVPTGPPELRSLAESFNRTAARIEELVGVQRSFVADASHQLRTPLAALRLRLENLEQAVPDADRDDLEGALAEVSRLSRLVDGLLALARAEGAPAQPESVVLAEVVRERVDAWDAYAAERSVEFTTTVADEIHVLSTPGRLEQELDNVFANALAVVPSGSSIEVRTRNDTLDGVELVISDQGPGMSEEQRARAFDRFWRAGPSDGRGSGLGLPIVRELARADGGDVALEPAAPSGLAVVITLRRAP